MAKKTQLRKHRSGRIINVTSKKQESDIIQATNRAIAHLQNRFQNKLLLKHSNQWFLRDIVADLRRFYPDVDFQYHFDTSAIRPDGGILHIEGTKEPTASYPILIAEVKNQDTNDLRLQEGLPRQAKGNAIERLGKNLIGFRTALIRETIFPFGCFGYGCAFETDSFILDLVSTMAMFGRLNNTYPHNQEGDTFDRGSFYFRPERWTVDRCF